MAVEIETVEVPGRKGTTTRTLIRIDEPAPLADALVVRDAASAQVGTMKQTPLLIAGYRAYAARPGDAHDR